MADYRLYFLDARGHIHHAKPLLRDTDQEAIDAVVDCPNDFGTELWLLERQVRVFPPKPSTEARPLDGARRPTSLERAYHLARTGACLTIADIKLRLRAEGLDESQVFGPTLLADLRRLCAAARGASLTSSPPEAGAHT